MQNRGISASGYYFVYHKREVKKIQDKQKALTVHRLGNHFLLFLFIFIKSLTTQLCQSLQHLPLHNTKTQWFPFLWCNTNLLGTMEFSILFLLSDLGFYSVFLFLYWIWKILHDFKMFMRNLKVVYFQTWICLL